MASLQRISQVVTCVADGEWNIDPALLNCESTNNTIINPSIFFFRPLKFVFLFLVIECGAVPLIGNATIVEQRVSEMFGAQITHRCPVGYGKDGGPENTIVTTCQPDQTWSNTQSACLSAFKTFKKL